MKSISPASLDNVRAELIRMLDDGIRCPEVRAKAVEVMVKDDEIASVFNWAKDNFTYVPDPYGKELFVSPKKLLEEHASTGTMHGDCDDAALFIASLLGSIGYETKINLLDCNFDGDYDHAIASIHTGDRWLDLDLVNTAPLGWIEEYKIRTDI